MLTKYEKLGLVIDFENKSMRDEDSEGFYF